jgi:hypothetical protein
VAVDLTKHVHPNHVGMIVQPSEWELDRRRTMINPTLSTLNGHREGLAANDPYSLNSAFKCLASIHPRCHRLNRTLMGVDVFGR